MPRVILIGYWRSDTETQWPDPRDFVDASWDQQERNMVVDHLMTAESPWISMGNSTCRFCQQPNGSLEQTDGAYLWPQGLAHYLLKHAVRLPEPFVEHVRSRQAEREADPFAGDSSWWKGLAHG